MDKDGEFSDSSLKDESESVPNKDDSTRQGRVGVLVEEEISVGRRPSAEMSANTVVNLLCLGTPLSITITIIVHDLL